MILKAVPIWAYHKIVIISGVWKSKYWFCSYLVSVQTRNHSHMFVLCTTQSMPLVHYYIGDVNYFLSDLMIINTYYQNETIWNESTWVALRSSRWNNVSYRFTMRDYGWWNSNASDNTGAVSSSVLSVWSSSLGTVILKGKLSFIRRMRTGLYCFHTLSLQWPFILFPHSKTLHRITFKRKCFHTPILSDSSILSSHLDWSV